MSKHKKLDLRPNYYSRHQAIAHCGVNFKTFYKYRNALGIIPCRVYQNGIYYDAESVAKIVKMRGMPTDLYNKHVKVRAHNLNEAYKTGRLP
ncbi:hypothetical protein LCGC14_1890430 [marine sediment metagenome]|uniref:HTH merR-type domain-containing protein n=1 Tax=marine sediment metagenome TaxID=412755 RepID=A0A0F9FZW7_9ZZZZ